MRNFFPAKVLLFGEHRVLRGASALAVPFPRLGVSWVKQAEVDDRLIRLAEFIQQNFSTDLIDAKQLLLDVREGWQLSSNVPMGYGMGSSGTVCAAVWDKYQRSEWLNANLNELKSLLGRMEGHFHGQSSGTDPLVSFIAKPISIGVQGVNTIELASTWEDHFFLLDTGLPRTSAPLIKGFLSKYDADASWRERVNDQWGKEDKNCQHAIRFGEWSSLKSAFRALSKAQFELVPELIPAAFRTIWKGDSYCFKICGAGGGGFLLGHTTDWTNTQSALSSYPLLRF